MSKTAIFFLLQAAVIFAAIDLQLENPEFKEGVLISEKGGFVRSDKLRFQADHITYNKNEHHFMAHGNVAILWHQKLFIAEKLEYNVKEKTGIAYQATGGIGAWVISGDTINLLPDGAVTVHNASISTSQDGLPLWDIYSQAIRVDKNERLETKAVQVRVQKFPIFWIPSFRLNLHPFKESTARYSVVWDKGQGPRFSMRYRLYSWNRFNLFGRIDYRWMRGPGGAIEASYYSARSKFKSQNYYAHDTFFNDDNPDQWRKLYRFQGIYSTHSSNEKTHLHLQYDKYSDQNMPLDFKTEDFEFNRAKKSELIASHRFTPVHLDARLLGRLNPFETTRQELPTINLALFPVSIGKTGAKLSGHLSSSYLEYNYSNDILQSLPNFYSYRGEALAQINRPFTFKGIHFNPYANVREIFYSRSQVGGTLAQTLFAWGGELSTTISKTEGHYKHTVKPYVVYDGLSKPTRPTSEALIFSFYDGWHRLNQLRIGTKQSLYFSSTLPSVDMDLFAYAFLGRTPFKTVFPKIDAILSLHKQQISFDTHARWDCDEQLFDFVNTTLAWTLSDDAAFSIELRHRSKYQWRKDAQNNFILDVTHSRSSLLATPLSDGRNTILTRLQLRPLPDWTVRLALHAGFGRGAREPGYIESQVDLITQLSSSWRMKLGYMHAVNDNQFSCSFSLIN